MRRKSLIVRRCSRMILVAGESGGSRRMAIAAATVPTQIASAVLKKFARL